jgi:ribonuclease BN (tRNA processing enzyme)
MQDQVEFVSLAQAEKTQTWPGVAGLSYRLARGQHSVPSYALRLDWNSGQSMVYSADTGPASAIGRLAAGVDLLVHDCFYLFAEDSALPGHAAAGQVGQLAAQAGVRVVALVHRMHTDPSLSEQYQAEAARYFRGKILTPHAGDQFVL